MAEVVGEGVIRIGADSSGFEKDLQEKTDSAARKSGSSFGKVLGGVAKTAVVGSLAAVGAAGGAAMGIALSKGFDRVRAIENAEAKLAGLGHTAEGVAEISNSALESVKGTAFGMGEAMSVAANMVASGIEPGQELTRTLKIIGDTAQISGGSMTEISAIFQSMAASGEVTGQKLHQLQGRGLPVFAMLAEAMGVTQEEAQKMVRNGEVSFDQFQTVLEENIGGAALKAGETFDGAMANIQAALGRIGAKFMGPVMEGLRDSFNGAIPVVDALGDVIEPVAEKFGEWVGVVVPKIVSGMESIPEKIEAVRASFEAFKSLLTDGFSSDISVETGLEEGSPLVTGLLWLRDTGIAIFEAVKDAVSGFIEGFGGFDQFAGTLGPIIKAMSGPLGLLRAVLMDMFSGTDFGAVGKGLGSTLAPILKLVSELAQILMGALGQALKLIIPIIVQLVKTVLPIMLDVFNALMPVVLEVAQVVLMLAGELLSKLMPVIAQLISTVMPILLDLFTTLVPVILEVVNAVVPLVMELASALIPVVMQVVEAIAPLITQLISGLAPIIVMVVKTVLPPLIKAFTGIMEVITKVVLPIISKLINFIAQRMVPIINNLTNVVKIVFEFISKTISNAMKFVQGVIDVVMGIISGDWGRVWDGIKGAASAVWDQIKNVVGTVIELVKDRIDAVMGTISEIWGNVWGAIFDTAERWVNKAKDTILDVFGSIRDGISNIWDKIIGVVGKPINAVIRFINDGLIGGYNSIAKTLGMGTIGRISEIRIPTASSSTGRGGASPVAAFQKGGYVDLPFSASRRDPYFGVTPDGLFKFEGEEFIVNRDMTRRFRPVLEMINSGQFDPHGLPGFKSGGMVSLRGHRFTALFASLLQEAEKIAGGTMRISQGGFRPKTSYSGTSHQGDAVDIGGSFTKFIAPLRSLGIPTWDRTGKGNWAPHAHGVPLPGSGRAAGSAIWQAQDYLKGGDGLGGRDNGPRGGALSGLIENIKAAISAGFSSVQDWFNGIVDKFTAPFQGFMDNMRAGGGVIADLVKGIATKLKDELTDWIKEKLGIGGSYASGTHSTRRGISMFGENGPELAWTPGGMSVLDARSTALLAGMPDSGVMGGRRSGDLYIGTLQLTDVKTLKDVQALLMEADDAKRKSYMIGAGHGYSG